MVAFSIYAFTKAKKKTVVIDTRNWDVLLTKHVLFYARLTEDNQRVFQKRMQLFLNEIYIEGVKTKITELDKILVAASAVIPVFGFKDWHYNNLSGVLLYPDTFNEDLAIDANAEGKKY
ncbi:MAG: Mlc titration factor MtfA (ptsG expression regulator) [Patiriisocius sp.]